MSNPDYRVSVEENYPDDANPALLEELFLLAEEAEAEDVRFDKDFNEWLDERRDAAYSDFDLF